MATAQKRNKSTSIKKWSDYVADLYDEKNLKHLRDIAVPEKQPPVFEYDPITGLYAFQENFEEEFVFTEEDEISKSQPVDNNEELPQTPATTQLSEVPPPMKGILIFINNH